MSPHLAGNCFLWALGSRQRGHVVTIDVSSELGARINELLRDELVILAEAEDGSSVPHATRPLSDAERASGVQFGELQAVQDAYLEAITPVILVLMGAAADAVTREAARVAMSATMLRVLDEWRTMPPRALQEALEVAVGRVDEALTVAYRESGMQVVAEASRQGVRIAAATEAPVWTQAQARIVASNATERVLDAAKTVYEQPRATITLPTVEEVQESVTGLSDKGPIDKARQAGNAVVNEGRFDTVAQAARQPAWIYSSEVMDGVRTCGPCQAIDGKEWRTIAEAREWYNPTMRDCLGQSRCRGTLVFVYVDDDAEAEWDAS